MMCCKPWNSNAFKNLLSKEGHRRIVKLSDPLYIFGAFGTFNLLLKYALSLQLPHSIMLVCEYIYNFLDFYVDRLHPEKSMILIILQPICSFNGVDVDHQKLGRTQLN
jgi:hypothetical protein